MRDGALAIVGGVRAVLVVVMVCRGGNVVAAAVGAASAVHVAAHVLLGLWAGVVVVPSLLLPPLVELPRDL